MDIRGANVQARPGGSASARPDTNPCVKLMRTTRTSDAGDPNELSPEDRELLQDPALREAFLEILTFSKRAKPIRTAAELAHLKEQAADACERFLQAAIIVKLPELVEGLPPEDRPTAEQRLRNLAAKWRAAALKATTDSRERDVP
jgi:hypothetical protein